MEGTNIQKFNEMSFNIDGEFFKKFEDQQDSNTRYQEAEENCEANDETHSAKEANYKEIRKNKRKTQGLSISDIPNNVFSQDHNLVHSLANSQDRDSGDEYKETINFGQMSEEKIKQFDNHRSPSQNDAKLVNDYDEYDKFISDPFYENNKFYGIEFNEREIVISPFKNHKENSADKHNQPNLKHKLSRFELEEGFKVKYSNEFSSPEQKCDFDDLKMRTIDIKAAIYNEDENHGSPFYNNLTGRSNPVGNKLPNNMKIQTQKFPGFRSKSRISELESNTNLETFKSDSSWIPTFSKFEYEEDYNGGKEAFDNICLSTDRISYFKPNQNNGNTKDAIRDFIDTDPMKISAILESHQPQLEVIFQINNELQK